MQESGLLTCPVMAWTRAVLSYSCIAAAQELLASSGTPSRALSALEKRRLIWPASPPTEVPIVIDTWTVASFGSLSSVTAPCSQSCVTCTALASYTCCQGIW